MAMQVNSWSENSLDPGAVSKTLSVHLLLQVDFSLDVEMAMPDILRKKLQCVKTRQTIHPNKMSSNLYYRFGRFLSGPLSAKSIANAIFHEAVGFSIPYLKREESLAHLAALTRDKSLLFAGNVCFCAQEEDPDSDKSEAAATAINQCYLRLAHQVESNKDELTLLNRKIDSLQDILKSIDEKLTKLNSEEENV